MSSRHSPRTLPGRPARRSALRRVAIAAVGAAIVTAAAAHEYYAAGFKIIHPWAMPTAAGASVAPVYMEFDEVSAADRLVAARSDLAQRVEMRGPPDADAADEDAAPVAAIAFSKDRTTRLVPGGPHLLLVGLKSSLVWGRSYPLTLVFEKAGAIETQLSVGAH